MRSCQSLNRHVLEQYRLCFRRPAAGASKVLVQPFRAQVLVFGFPIASNSVVTRLTGIIRRLDAGVKLLRPSFAEPDAFVFVELAQAILKVLRAHTRHSGFAKKRVNFRL